MKAFLKKFRRLIPITVWLITALILFIFCKLTGWGLRTAPLWVMFLLLAVAIGALLNGLYDAIRFRIRPDSRAAKATVRVVALIIAAAYIFLIFFGSMVLWIKYANDEIVFERDGQTLILRNKTILAQEYYPCYEYKGHIFYGKYVYSETSVFFN